jgi:cephalosporin-C deacetylase-like acetyl esterase
MMVRRSVFCLVAIPAITALWAAAQTGNSSRQQLVDALDKLANQQLAARANLVAKIQSSADADRRKAQVRAKILDLIGNLPASSGAPAVKNFGTIEGDGFHIEKLAYESLPGFWVTANLYLPASGAGPFPAVLLAPGHEATGKQSQYSFGGNFARSGIVALAIDPLGQGERLQYFDPGKKASIIGGSTGEHGEANIPAMLLGQDVARYFVHDSMRGIDYLTTRPEVDAQRIGALGCSGGGTSTAYLAALDDRVKVAGVACYITSFKELLPSATGVQEAEQSVPHFIEQGLDFGDYVELFAPKPYAIISTMSDMFPFEGARQTYEEAKRFYKLYGAEDKLQWITGPGGHGNLGPISPAILGFFLHYLKDAPAGDAAFTPLRVQDPSSLLDTPSGQVAVSIGGQTVPSLIRAEAASLLPARRPSAKDVTEAIRSLTGVIYSPGEQRPSLEVTSEKQQGTYREFAFVMRHDGADVTGRMAIPGSSGRKDAILLLQAQETEFDRLAQAGRVTMALDPRPSQPGTEGLKSSYLGPFNLISLRAFLVGRTILGMRVDDVIQAVDWLASDPDVSRKITLYGNGAMGAVALHAAALDPRISGVVIENTLASYRMILDEPLHRNVSEIVIPGVLKKYDLGDLMLAIAPRPVTVIDPRDASGATITADQFRKELSYVPANRVQVIARGGEGPLPID